MAPDDTTDGEAAKVKLQLTGEGGGVQRNAKKKGWGEGSNMTPAEGLTIAKCNGLQNGNNKKKSKLEAKLHHPDRSCLPYQLHWYAMDCSYTRLTGSSGMSTLCGMFPVTTHNPTARFQLDEQ